MTIEVEAQTVTFANEEGAKRVILIEDGAEIDLRTVHDSLFHAEGGEVVTFQ